MNPEPIRIQPVFDGEERSVLQPLLTEFHEWMHDHAPAYDPADELQDDLSGLTAESVRSWAWVARRGDRAVGCVLLFGLNPEFAEFRRLWVRPSDRGSGVGRRLVETVIVQSATEGFDRVGLTAPPWGEAALALYREVGFEQTNPYPETRLPEEYHADAIFMQLEVGEEDAHR